MTTASSQPVTDNGKIIAIISYITLIGWIVALVMHNGNKTKLGAFHLRQVLGFMIVGFVVQIVLSILIGIMAAISGTLAKLVIIVSVVAFLGLFVLWVLGLLSAIKCEEKPMPFIGEKIQSALKSVFAS